MPTYEYRCHKCGKTFDVRQSFSDEPLKTHEECGGELERLVSVPALQFKGSGFYITDYAKGGNSSSPAKGNSGEKTESKSDSKTESKPETKTETKSSTADTSSSTTSKSDKK